MGALSHDFSRTIRSKTVFISMVMIILLSLAAVPLIKLSQAQGSFSSGGNVVLVYYKSPDYHFLAFSYNTYGQPVSGTPLNVTVTDLLGVHSAESSTNSSGSSSWAVAGEPTGQVEQFTIEVGGPLGGYESSGGGFPITSDGQPVSLLSSPIGTVTDPTNSSRTDVIFTYEGPNGTIPENFGVYYVYSTGSGTTVTAPSPDQMNLLGYPSSFVSIFNLPQAPAGSSTLTVGAFSKNGSGGSSFVTTYSQNLQPTPPPSPNTIFTGFFSGVMSLVVPIMAIFVAYGTYGKDKTTGILESVLTRPVTRRGLILSRYLSIVIALVVALLVTTGIMELISQLLLGTVMPPAFAAYTVVALAVEGASFVGIVMLFSHFLRSSGSLVGIGIGLWIILDFFWSIILVFAAFASGVQIGSGNFLGITIDSAFFNPAQFYSLVGEFLNGVSISNSLGGSIPISPATYGLTSVTLVLTGLFWVLAPIASVLYFAPKRD